MDMKLEAQSNRLEDAEEALEKADAAALMQLYKRAESDLITMIEGLEVMCRKDQLKPMQSDTAISAMRDVALAALELAKSVSNQQDNPGGKRDG